VEVRVLSFAPAVTRSVPPTSAAVAGSRVGKRPTATRLAPPECHPKGAGGSANDAVATALQRAAAAWARSGDAALLRRELLALLVVPPESLSRSERNPHERRRLARARGSSCRTSRMGPGAQRGRPRCSGNSASGSECDPHEPPSSMGVLPESERPVVTPRIGRLRCAASSQTGGSDLNALHQLGPRLRPHFEHWTAEFANTTESVNAQKLIASKPGENATRRDAIGLGECHRHRRLREYTFEEGLLTRRRLRTSRERNTSIAELDTINQRCTHTCAATAESDCAQRESEKRLRWCHGAFVRRTLNTTRRSCSRAPSLSPGSTGSDSPLPAT
jgi:hypothetical protein